jgi:hypothetical protein
VLLLCLALLVSPRRRRTVVQFGVWLVIAAVTVTAGLRAVRGELLEKVPAGTYRDGAFAALTMVTHLLRERAIQLTWLGALLAVVAYLAGPGRIPRFLRRQVVRAGRAVARWVHRATRTLRAYGPAWVARHFDAVRIAGVVVAVAVALLFVSSWIALVIVALVLVGYETVAYLLVPRG